MQPRSGLQSLKHLQKDMHTGRSAQATLETQIPAAVAKSSVLASIEDLLADEVVRVVLEGDADNAPRLGAAVDVGEAIGGTTGLATDKGGADELITSGGARDWDGAEEAG